MPYQAIKTTSNFNSSDFQNCLSGLKIKTEKLNEDVEEYIYTGDRDSLIMMLMQCWGMDRDVAEFQVTKIN